MAAPAHAKRILADTQRNSHVQIMAGPIPPIPISLPFLPLPILSRTHTQMIPFSPTHCLPITGLVKSCYRALLPMLAVSINPCPEDTGLNFPLIHI